MRARLLYIVTESYWFVPGLMAVAAVALGFVMPYVDARLDPSWLEQLYWVAEMDAHGAQSVLSTIAGSMITVAGVAFSITIAAVSYASSQYGPRVLSNFMGDRGNQVTLGTFISTFLYGLLVLRSVRTPDNPPGEWIPHLSVLLALGLAIASIGMLVYFIHHIPMSIHPSHVVAQIGVDLQGHLERLFPRTVGHDAPEDAPHVGLVPDELYEEAVPVVAERTGYIQNLDVAAIMRVAKRHDLVIRLLQMPGDFVSEGRTLALVWPPGRVVDRLADGVRRSFAVGRRRTADQDVLFLVSELVEIAARALSPGVNDPFTAMSCVDWLVAALAQVSHSDLPGNLRYGDDGRLRVITPKVSFEDFADASFDKLRTYVTRDRNAALHALQSLAGLTSHLADHRDRATVFEHAQALWREASRRLEDPRDRERLDAAWRSITLLYHEPSGALAVGGAGSLLPAGRPSPSERGRNRQE